MRTAYELRPFFEPSTVAVIGARSSHGFGYLIPPALIEAGYSENMYLVNPTSRELWGRPVYPSIEQVPREVELAIVIVKAQLVPDILKQCARKGVRAAIVESAGFSETGEEGSELEHEIARVAGDVGIRVLGPNCVGTINLLTGFTTTDIHLDHINRGGVSLIAQSGVFGTTLLDASTDFDIGFARVVTMGNRCDVDESDIISFLAEDASTRVIGIYLEGVRDGRRFLATAAWASQRKPLVILKGGRSPHGRRATLSHTGTLAGEDRIYDAALRQAGAVRVNDIAELLETCNFLDRLATHGGGGLAVVTNSGSLGVLAADECHRLGLPMADLSDSTLARVREDAPSWMNVSNPLDVGPSMLYPTALEAVDKDEGVGAILCILAIPRFFYDRMEQETGTAVKIVGEVDTLSRMAETRPVAFVVLGGVELRRKLRRELPPNIAISAFPENAVKALAASYRRRSHAQGTGRENLRALC